MLIKRNKRFSNAKLDSFRKITPEHAKLIDYLHYCLINGFKENVFICGDVGVGKTYIGYSLLEETTKIIKFRGSEYYDCKNIYYIKMDDLFEQIKSSFSDKELYPENTKNVSVLIIDEVKQMSEWESSEFFTIIDSRYNDMLPTIIISNLREERLKIILGPRIYDRLFGNIKKFCLIAPSGRKDELFNANL